MSEKARIANDLYYILEDANCNDCPLDEICTVVTSNSSKDNICLTLKNESEEK